MSRDSDRRRPAVGLSALAAAVLTVALVAMSGFAAVVANEPLHVFLRNHQFEPNVVRAIPGQAIRFENTDDVLHSLTLIGHEDVIGEEFVEPGQSYTIQIPEDLLPGAYELACTIHVDMRGRLFVSEK